jgi:hypothetical protein
MSVSFTTMHSGRNVEKELPPNMAEPRGRSVTISTFVDTNHEEGNVIMRHLHGGIFLFVENASTNYQPGIA